jgi:hypothetical protein
MWAQLAQADSTVQDFNNYCLRFTQKVFSAPARYPSAWSAWLATEYKHQDTNYPEGVAVPVWFSWYGDIDGTGAKDWGHVATRFPDGRVLSSPGKGYGQQWFASVDAQARAYSCKYVGWSEDLNGLKIVQYTNTPNTEDDEMANSQYFIASSDSPSGLVKTNDVWVRPAPGEALHYLTAGQAHDWFAMQKLDYNAPNVFSKEGGWFDLAFQEDIEAAKKTADAGKVK